MLVTGYCSDTLMVFQRISVAKCDLSHGNRERNRNVEQPNKADQQISASLQLLSMLNQLENRWNCLLLLVVTTALDRIFLRANTLIF